MAETTRLGLVAVAPAIKQPTSMTEELLKLGTYRTMADGTLVFDHTVTKKRWEITWDYYSVSDNLAAIRDPANAAGSVIWSPPVTTASYAVLSTDYSEEFVKAAGGEILYNISLTLEEIL